MFLLQSKKGDKDQESIQSQCLFMCVCGGGGGGTESRSLEASGASLELEESMRGGGGRPPSRLSTPLAFGGVQRDLP